MFSPLQLREYSLELLLVEANANFVGGAANSYENQLNVDFDFKRDHGTKNFQVILDVDVNPAKEMFEKATYRIKIKLRTNLEFEGDYPEEQIPNLLGPNGLAMAYSIARGIVGQATGTSLHGKFILPTVNFIEVLKAKALQKEVSKSA